LRCQVVCEHRHRRNVSLQAGWENSSIHPIRLFGELDEDDNLVATTLMDQYYSTLALRISASLRLH
jgi:hypothetical protein